MYLSIALAIAGSAAAHPLSSRGNVASFPAGSSWDILLSKGDVIGNIKQQVAEQNFQVIDLDLFDTDAATISELKATKQVICYFSAGSREDWRPDAGDFKDGDTGKGLDGWQGESWVNVKSENVRNIMKKRIQKAADDGCSAVDPDNVDGFDGGQDGFGYDKSAYVDYVKFLAQEASAHNLSMGLKNAVDLIPDVVDVMQFAINEQCHEYSGECDLYKPFTDQNKAVFNIEYGGDKCQEPSGVKLSTVVKPEDLALNTLGGACPGQNQGTPINGNNPQTSVAPAPTKPTSTSTKAPAPTATQPQPTNIPNEEGEGPDDENPEDPENPEEPAPKPTPTAKPKPGATGRPSKPWGWGSRPTKAPKPYWWGHKWGNGKGGAAKPKPSTPAPKDSDDADEESYDDDDE